jgi:hypothetical protein
VPWIPIEPARPPFGPRVSGSLVSTRFRRDRYLAQDEVAILDKRAMSDWALVAVEEAIERAEARHARARTKAKAE